MEKSIESIWKEGFIKNDTLIAPKLNDLYNQKSEHTIDKFKRMGKNNLYAIVAGAFVFFTLSLIAGIPIYGAILSLMLLYLVLVGKKQGKALEKIDKGLSSYNYLKAFDVWLKNSIAEYARIYRFVYPLIFLVFTLGIFSIEINKPSLGEKVLLKIMNNPDTLLVGGLPIIWISAGLIILGAISYFSGRLYKLDLNIVYGPIFQKIEDLLSDMEELRK